MLSDIDMDTIMASPSFREVFEEGVKRGRERARRDVVEEMIRALLVRHLRRDLTPDECSTVAARASTLDPSRAFEVIRLDRDAFYTWLFGTNAE